MHSERSIVISPKTLAKARLVPDTSSFASASGHLFRTPHGAENLFDIDDHELSEHHRPVRSSVDLDYLLAPAKLTKVGLVGTRNFVRVARNVTRDLPPGPSNLVLETARFTMARAPHGAVIKWSAARSTVRKWVALDADWDCDGALPPSREQLRAALEFAKRAEQFAVPEPDPYIASDSEIGFSWAKAGASASFLLDGRFLAFCPNDEGEPIRVSGPLDIAAASTKLFQAYAKII